VAETFFPAALRGSGKYADGGEYIQHLVSNHKTADEPPVAPVYFKKSKACRKADQQEKINIQHSYFS